MTTPHSLTQTARAALGQVQGKPVFSLNTGIDPASLEGLRLVKASRGTGWLYRADQLTPWETKGILQEKGLISVWGPAEGLETVDPVEGWPLDGPEGWAFLQALAQLLGALEGAEAPLPRFSPCLVLPWKDHEGRWAFAVLPPELAAGLSTVEPLDRRRMWEPFLHPDADGPRSWAFFLAACTLHLALGALPWDQDDETLLRQEIRELKKNSPVKLLPGLTGPGWDLLNGAWTQETGPRWARDFAAWASSVPWSAWDTYRPSGEKSEKILSGDRQRRDSQRRGRLFWRRRGSLVFGFGLAGLIVLALGGWFAWEQLKPDPSDLYTPEQTVRLYYQMRSDLNDLIGKKLVAGGYTVDSTVGQDVNLVNNLFIAKQVRMGYERVDPLYKAERWTFNGRPKVPKGKILWGLVNVQIAEAPGSTPERPLWSARYEQWEMAGGEASAEAPQGIDVTDQVELVKTGRGWKVKAITRTQKPLP